MKVRSETPGSIQPPNIHYQGQLIIGFLECQQDIAWNRKRLALKSTLLNTEKMGIRESNPEPEIQLLEAYESRM